MNWRQERSALSKLVRLLLRKALVIRAWQSEDRASATGLRRTQSSISPNHHHQKMISTTSSSCLLICHQRWNTKYTKIMKAWINSLKCGSGVRKGQLIAKRFRKCRRNWLIRTTLLLRKLNIIERRMRVTTYLWKITAFHPSSIRRSKARPRPRVLWWKVLILAASWARMDLILQRNALV